MDAPGSFVGIDPGRTMGFASCLAGGEELRHGTWKFNDPVHGGAFAQYAKYLRTLLESLPNPLVGIELMTIVAHKGQDGREHIDAKQVAFSSGWPTHLQTICYSMGLREPVFVPIQSWRSKTHGITRTPRQSRFSDTEKMHFFKDAAKQYCDAAGWSYSTPDEAEALCILDYMRIENEPSYAFDKGRSYQQENLFA